MKKKFIIKSPIEMEKFAATLAKTLKGGEVLALEGELGAGKTSFVQGVAKMLGVKQNVQSPTFLLMKCYPIKKVQGSRLKVQTLCHVDAYRIKNERELVTIGLVEQMNEPWTVTAIEWADLVPGLIPGNAITIRFAHGKKDSERIVTVTRN